MIRRFREEDIGRVVRELIVPMLYETKSAEEIVEEDIINTCKLVLDTGVGIVLEKGGELLGCVGGIIGGEPFNRKKKTLHEVIWYVIPKERNKKGVFNLFYSFIDEGKEKGAEKISFSPSTGVYLKDEFFTKRGFNNIAQVYVLNTK